jgi:parallel beta-helix repeat protein
VWGIIGSDSLIANNRIYGLTAHEGSLRGISCGGSNATVSGNRLSDLENDGTVSYAIGIFATSVSNLMISNNTISDIDISNAASSNDVSGIEVWLGTSSLVTSNTIDTLTNSGSGNADGIYIYANSTTVTGNTIDSCADGGVVIRSDNCTVSGNNITGCDDGVETESLADKTAITGNVLLGNTSNAINDNGSNTFYQTATDSDPLNVVS